MSNPCEQSLTRPGWQITPPSLESIARLFLFTAFVYCLADREPPSLSVQDLHVTKYYTFFRSFETPSATYKSLC
jgi:hypothetical protein